jgi:salicylate hydroxylase
VAPAQIRICDVQTGRQITSIELGDTFARRFAAPYRVAHRADLINGLATTVAGHDNITLKTSSRVSGVVPGSAPALKFLSGEQETSDLVVVADGIRSQLRENIAPGMKPRPSGETLFRALAPASALPATLDPKSVYLWLGPRGHVVHYAVSGGRRVNIVASLEAQHAMSGWNGHASRDDVLGFFSRLNPDLRQCLEAPASWLSWTGADLQPFSGWSSGACVLTGDAAHASLPYLAQGAAMALEDASVLSKCIGSGEHTGIAEALARFEAERQPRTARITLASRRNARIYHMTGAAAVARNLALRVMPGTAHLRQLAWIYA